MKFTFLFYKAALHIAVEKKNVEMIKLLLENRKINMKAKDNICF